MIKDKNFYKIILMSWANGEIFWGLYSYFFNVHSSDYNILMPIRVILALCGYMLVYLNNKDWFSKYQERALIGITILLSTHMFYYAFVNYDNWKVIAGVIVPLSIVVSFFPTIKSLIIGTVLICGISWFVPDVNGDKYFFVNIITYAGVSAIFKYYYIKRTMQLHEEKKKIKEQENLVSLGNFTKGISHELNNQLMRLSLQQESLMEKINPEFQNLLDVKDEIKNIDIELKNIQKVTEKLGLFSYCKFKEKKYKIKELVSELKFQYPNVSFIVESKIEEEYLKTNLKYFTTMIASVINNAIESNSKIIDLKIFINKNILKLQVINDGEKITNPEKIFEGFYSEKDVSKHMGLGLSLSRHIVHRHNGQLNLLENKEKNMVVFEFSMPIVN